MWTSVFAVALGLTIGNFLCEWLRRSGDYWRAVELSWHQTGAIVIFVFLQK